MVEGRWIDGNAVVSCGLVDDQTAEQGLYCGLFIVFMVNIEEAGAGFSTLCELPNCRKHANIDVASVAS